MILVLLGTQDKPFTRLLKAIDRACMIGDIKETVIVQAGHTKYTPHELSKNMRIYDFINAGNINEYMKHSHVIITHGGVGSIMSAIKMHKKVIAVPRLKKYKEHTNDHQIQIVERFSKEGYILYLSDLEKLDEYIKKIDVLKFKDFKSNKENIINLVDDFIKEN